MFSDTENKSTKVEKSGKFKCRFCEKVLASNTNLINHERIHTGEKPYKCKYCGRGFTEKGNMRVHEFKHLYQ